MKWFNPTPKSLEELKKQYRVLAMKHHPDCGGSTADMQSINAEYDLLFAKLKDIHTAADGSTYKATTTETPEQFRSIIEKLITLDGVVIEIVGSWLWLTGNTYIHREQIKALGFRWANSKKAWYYHIDEYRKTSKKTFTLEQIRELYGAQTITSKPPLKLTVV